MFKNQGLALWSEPLVPILLVLLIFSSVLVFYFGTLPQVWEEAYALMDREIEDLEQEPWGSPYKEAIELKQYQEGLREFYQRELKEVQKKRQLSIFQTPYSTKKLAMDGKHLQGLQEFPEASFNDGFYRSMLGGFHLDLLWIFFLLLIGYFIFLQDRNELDVLYRSMPKAGLLYYINKWIFFLLVALLGFFILQLGPFLRAYLTYPLDSMPIQGIFGMKDVYLPITAGKFVVYNLALRFLRGFFLASLFPLLYGALGRKSYALLGVLFIFSYGAYFGLPEQSAVSLFKYINLLGAYAMPRDIFLRPLATVGSMVFSTSTVFMAVFLLYLVSFPLFYKAYEKENRVKKAKNKKGGKATLSYPLHLVFDSLFTRRAIVFVLLALFYWISLPVLSSPPPQNYLEEIKKETYLSYGGTLSKEKVERILDRYKVVQEEEKRYDELSDAFLKSKAIEPSDELMELKKGYLERLAFQEFFRETQFSLMQGKPLHNPEFYRIFLSFEQHRYLLKDFLINTLLLLLVLSFGIAPLVHEEEDFFRSFLLGRCYRMKWILLLGGFFCLIFTFSPMLAHGLRIGKAAAFTGFSMPMSTLFLDASPFHFGGYLLMKSLGILFVYLLLFQIILLTGRRFSSAMCFLVSFSVLFVFLLLHLMSPNTLDPLMMLGNELKHPSDFIGIYLFSLGLLFLGAQFFQKEIKGE